MELGKDEDDDPREFACPDCGKKFIKPGYVGAHMRFCSGDVILLPQLNPNLWAI